MDRRKVLKSSAAAAMTVVAGVFPVPAKAVIPPVLVALSGVAFSVAVRRYVVGPFMALLARWFPSLFASELRKYLMGVAAAFGLSKSKAALVAEIAENEGAHDLAKDGIERTIDLAIQNSSNSPLELARLNLLLVDVQSQTVELRSATSWGLVVAPSTTMYRQITAKRYPKAGMKQWYLADSHRTLAISKQFMVVTGDA